MKTKVTESVVETSEPRQSEVFAEVPLFDQKVVGGTVNADCSCFSCDGNPCNK